MESQDQIKVFHMKMVRLFGMQRTLNSTGGDAGRQFERPLRLRLPKTGRRKAPRPANVPAAPDSNWPSVGNQAETIGNRITKGISRAERYRKLAVKYHELAKFARPDYLGDFYRNVAVRYVFMAQEVSERANKEVGVTPGSPADECGGGHASQGGQDLDLLAVWAGDSKQTDCT
jgi:hypothetical protein